MPKPLDPTTTHLWVVVQHQARKFRSTTDWKRNETNARIISDNTRPCLENAAHTWAGLPVFYPSLPNLANPTQIGPEADETHHAMTKPKRHWASCCWPTSCKLCPRTRSQLGKFGKRGPNAYHVCPMSSQVWSCQPRIRANSGQNPANRRQLWPTSESSQIQPQHRPNRPNLVRCESLRTCGHGAFKNVTLKTIEHLARQRFMGHKARSPSSPIAGVCPVSCWARRGLAHMFHKVLN